MRHGATEWNEKKRVQGRADVPLNDRGRRQAEEIAGALHDRDIDAVYSSDLERARDTAQPVADDHGVDVEEDAAFREIDQGEWEGLHDDEVARRWPEIWGRARHYNARPGGESPQEVRARSLAGLRRIVEKHPTGTVAVVSHGGTIRWLVAEALGYDDRQSARLRGMSNGSIVSLEVSLDGGRLTFDAISRFDGASTDLDDPNQ